MEDLRVVWMRDRVYAALGLQDEGLFRELLAREEGRAERELLAYLDQPAEQLQSSAILFLARKVVVDVEQEEEPEESLVGGESDEDEDGQGSGPTSEVTVDQQSKEAEESGSEVGTGESVAASSATDKSHDTEADKQDETQQSVLRKKIVQVEQLQLQMTHKHLPTEDSASSSPPFFFIRAAPDPVPCPSSPEEATGVLAGCFELGTVDCGHPLQSLAQTLTHLYVPMLTIAGQRSVDDEVGKKSSSASNQSGGSPDRPVRTVSSRMKNLMRDELLINVRKFETQVSHVLQQVEGEIKLKVPDIDLGEDPVSVASEAPVVAQLENTMEEWSRILSSVVETQLNKTPSADGPLAEVDFWRERNSVLGMFYEQLKLPQVQKVVVVLKTANSPIYSNFEYHRTELNRYYTEAKDNVKFLGTLERHFKNLAQGANFSIVLDTLPNLMNSLRMVWVISRHYNTDDRMAPLMERIAWVLCDRATTVVNHRNIFKHSLTDIKEKSSEARLMLETWKKCYLEVREKIEQSGRDTRWEFDRKRLFEHSDHIAQVCKDICKIAQIIEEFRNIFGAELKAVTGNPAGIEAVLEKVNNLMRDIEKVRFDPFDPAQRQNWASKMGRFQQEVQLIEEEANQFINDSFQSLRSAEGAFEMMKNFKHMRSRAAINETMKKQLKEILTTFMKEVDTINDLFQENRDSPPVSKNQPPAAGAIMWCRSLFQRIKGTVLRFQTMKELFDSETGKAASRHYLSVAREMKQFEDDVYTQWVAKMEETLPALLKRPILCKPPPTPAPASTAQTPLPGDSRSASRAADYSHILPPLLPANCEFVVNFSPELSVIIRESCCMEKLGFHVPDLARNVALQEEKFLEYCSGLENSLSRYHSLLASLTEAETELLGDHIRTLQRALRAGFKRLNWNSLGIHDYIAKCEKSLTKFESLASQVQKNSGDIQERLNVIENVRLFKQPPAKPGADLVDAKDYYDFQEEHRRSVLCSLGRKYHAIGPLLIKVEGLVVQSNTGKCPRLARYYEHWEVKVFQSLVKMVLKNMQYYNALLLSGTPLFVVGVLLSPPDIALFPHCNELQGMMMHAVIDIVEGTKKFPRWMRGSCIEAPPQTVPGQDEPVRFTFFSDVSVHPEVSEMGLHVKDSIRCGLLQLAAHANSWKKFKLLWRMNRDVMLEKFAQRQPSCEVYDEKMHFYSQVVSEVDAQPAEKEVEFARLNLDPLAASLRENARQWVMALGKRLNDAARTKLTQLRTELETSSANLDRPCGEHLEDLKFVLSEIANIRRISLDVELKYRDIQECYRTLAMYHLPVAQEEQQWCTELEPQWVDLAAKARQRDRDIIPDKKRFTVTTQEQVKTFQTKSEEFNVRFKTDGPTCVGPDLDKGVALLKEYRTHYSEFEAQRGELTNAEKLFDLSITGYPHLLEVEKDLKNSALVFELYEAQRLAREEWSGTLWANLDIQVLTDGIEEFMKRLRKFPKEVKALAVCHVLEERMREFKDSIPLFADLKNDALRDRHWEKLMESTGKNFDMNPETFTLENLFAMELHNFADTISDIVGSANKELSIEKSLSEVVTTWHNQRFSLHKYMKGTVEHGTLLGAVDEIVMTLDDNSMNLQSMSASRYVGPFLEKVQKWEKSLSHISEVVEIWMVVQRKWMYLESIFLAGDIRAQLPEEAKKFDNIDKLFKKIMTETSKNPLVLDACHAENRLHDLQSIENGLERCQKSLNDYLDSKRNAFPRFFFISDDELLSILGSHECTCVQEHMIKMFDNISKLQFVQGPGGESIANAMISSEGEMMEYRKGVPAEGKVEDWMTGVLNEMRQTNRLITKEAVFLYCEQKTRVEWMYDYQGMVILAANQVWWTWEVEDVFRKVKRGDKMGMKNYSKKLHGQIDDLVVQVRSQLSKNDRKKFNSVLIVDVHNRDIIDRFVRDSILEAREFEWESQLRFYWEKDSDQLLVQQCTGKFGFGYEYMGLNGRLVITSLTDRIYLTITQALSMHLGGAPAGPAGTGKTETVKDLAKAMGLLCVVTNCGEGMDYKAVGKIYSGLCQCGAWGCFDEFNRIDISVLSVISTQIKTIQNALINKYKRFQFEGVEIALDDRVGIFITMNPGYAGRTELPESVKALFRPVVVIVPDLQQICEIMLFSEGFLMAKVLAKKMTVLYKLAKGQLSRQYHYDFGLRALKAVLVMAGELKRGSPDLNEDVVLMRALRDMNLPKFVFEDVPLFLGLIGDLFPGLDCPRVRYPKFNDAVEDILMENKYILLPNQADKVVQLYETMLTRHTCMIVGPTGGGKSVVINTLAQSQTRLGLSTKLYTINPKAVTVIELYGILDPVTRDWTDGLLSNIFREVNRPTEKSERKYILFDGDVDALWVENMNSVMDDNKLLTLANGERIRLQKHCALLVEVGDLQYASPATVSRCGMVFVDPKNLGYKPYWERWVNGHPSKADREEFAKLYDKYVPQCVSLILEGIMDGRQGEKLKTILPVTNLNLVTQLCNMLDSLLPQPDEETKEKGGAGAGLALGTATLECYFLTALYWSLGACLVEESRVKFDAYVKKLANLTEVPGEGIVAGPGEIPVHHSTLYEYFYDGDEGKWVPWVMKVPEYVHNPSLPYNEILVPTVDTVCNTWLLELMVKIKRPVVLVGETGTSKTATTQNFLRELDPYTTMLLNVNFSSRTTSMDVQRNLEASMEKRMKDVYGPPPGKRLLVFIDDMNMPQVDTYGTQQPIALLKLLLEKGGMFDRGKDLNWKMFKDVQLIAAMGKAGGGRNEVDPRFISLFSAFNATFPSMDSLSHIYFSIITGHLQTFKKSVQALAKPITDATIELYQRIVRDLPPTPSKFHYIFNLRDLSRIYHGLFTTLPDRFQETGSFVRVWRNECLRVFYDRLTNDKDRGQVSDHLSELLQKHFQEQSEVALRDPLLYGDYRTALQPEQPRVYEDIQDYEAARGLFDEILEEYNENHKRMNLVLFDNALEHLTRIHRVIRMDQGHALLVGVGGSGRQSLARLAAFAAGYEVFEITLSRGYGEEELREDLKQLYHKLGLENKKMVFLFTDGHVAQEGFLELVNNMLTSGMVPALFPDDEKEQIIGQVRDEAMKAGRSPTRESVWSYFVKKSASNLHIVLCMSPSGELLKTRCRNFPGLVNNTSIDWFTAWPKQALQAVASQFLAENDLIPDDHQPSVVEHVVHVHLSVGQFSKGFQQKLRRSNHVTPKNYLDFISSYTKLLREKDKYICDQCSRLSGGLTKLNEASEQIKVLNEQLEVQKVAVTKKSAACEELLTDISSKQEIGTQKKQEAEKKSEEIEEQNKVIAKEKSEAEESLAEALPALEEARLALDNLNKNDVTEIRSFAKPPQQVQTVCECVVIMRGFKEVSWKTAKGMMSDTNFLNSLKNMDVDGITVSQVNIM
jgi:dynein heavy chain